MAFGLADLPEDVLLVVLEHLDPLALGRAELAVAQLWRLARKYDRFLWRPHCVAVFGSDPTAEMGAHDNPILQQIDPVPGKSCYAAYAALSKEFGRYTGNHVASASLVGRTVRALAKIKKYVPPPVVASLAPGCTEEEVDELDNVCVRQLKHPLPLSIRVLLRLVNGQDLLFDRKLAMGPPFNFDASDIASISHGVFGGYSVYNSHVNSRLIGISEIISMLKEQEMKMLPFAVNFNRDAHRTFMLELSTGHVYVNAREDTSLLAAPRTEDALTNWLEEYASRLQRGYYTTTSTELEGTRTDAINLFPRIIGSERSSVATKSVRVDCAICYRPEMAQGSNHVWTYSVEFSLLSQREQEESLTPNDRMQSAQLKSRHWQFCKKDGTVDRVDGDAVIGEYPLLELSDEAPFVYQSQVGVEFDEERNTQMWMKGHFRFVEGSLRQPKGDFFNANCGIVHFEVPTYIY